MKELLLAADVGGTKTRLALFTLEDGSRLGLLEDKEYASRDLDGIEAALDDFLDAGRRRSVSRAAFGIPGPVFGDVAHTTNLPWEVRASRLSEVLGGSFVRLLNDVAATAAGALYQDGFEPAVLHPGVEKPGAIGVLAPGTGLGQAILVPADGGFVVQGTEGGHVDFGPRSEEEVALWRFVAKTGPRVTYETLASGPGLGRIYDFLVERGDEAPSEDVRRRIASGEDRGAVVGEAAVEGSCAVSRRAVETFLSILGAQAGNLALAAFTIGGVVLGGGILPRLEPLVGSSGFLEAFRSKAPYESWISEIPVRVLGDDRAALWGAARVAAHSGTESGPVVLKRE